MVWNAEGIPGFLMSENSPVLHTTGCDVELKSLATLHGSVYLLVEGLLGRHFNETYSRVFLFWNERLCE
jgi:hypothetical protein